MQLISLLRTITTYNLRRMVVMALVAALSNALVLALINSAADRGALQENDGRELRLAVMFVIVVAVFTISQRYLMLEAAREIEAMIHRIRRRLIEAVRHSELSDIEHIGRTRIFNGVSKEIQTLAQSSNAIAVTFQLALLVIFTTIYLMWLSVTAFVLAVVFMAVAITLYLGRMKRMNLAVREATSAEYRLHELFTGIVEGFKEVTLNSARSQALADDVGKASLDAANERIKAQTEFARNFVFAQNVFFLLLGTMVFIVPAVSDAAAYSETLLKTTTAVLFVIGPISGVVGSVPILATANTSATYIIELQRLLEQSAKPPGAREELEGLPRRTFREIELRGVRFRFDDGETQYPFQVGPLDLTIRAGELIIVSGGNGSGKSTLMLLLAALYWPQAGTILVDGRPVTRSNVESYRTLFSAVFSDYHLFKKLYGIEPDAVAEAPELLRLFEIENKASVQDGAFTTIDLSAGQRKRLALVVALLERRSICILDEWAADQDPIFRRKFYDEILPVLQARGITVIAVSHDDRYYDRAERRLHMEEGKIVSDVKEAACA